MFYSTLQVLHCKSFAHRQKREKMFTGYFIAFLITSLVLVVFEAITFELLVLAGRIDNEIGFMWSRLGYIGPALLSTMISIIGLIFWSDNTIAFLAIVGAMGLTAIFAVREVFKLIELENTRKMSLTPLRILRD